MGTDDTSTTPAAAAILLAAGSSTRMRRNAAGVEVDTDVRKPLVELGGRTLLELACAAFDAVTDVVEIVIVAHADDLAAIEALRAERPGLEKVRRVITGGTERTDSVRIGCRAVSAAVDVLAIHDAARPFVTPELIRRTITAAAIDGAALPCMPVGDTLKASEDGHRVTHTVDRAGLYAAQTPQCFRRERFLELLAEAEREAFRPTDDAALWERYVGAVTIVAGDPLNHKVTTPEDLELGRALLADR